MSLERIKDIFQRALDTPPDERPSFLHTECGEDERLRLEVEALLGAHEEAGDFLACPTEGAQSLSLECTTTEPTEGAGAVIGRYRLCEEIGQGGFGVVWRAEQLEPVTREVALKVIKLGMDTRQVVARFEAERQALALMDHPHIARVLDGGATQSGRPFFVMELVEGVPITDYCDRAGLDNRRRLELFAQVCDAVQHAHQKGIIHRDLKPTNILVTGNGAAVPKVIDFGIAKATDKRLTEHTLSSDLGQMIGTPEYMSPEQAELTDVDVDTRADIYSLGVLLYEMLTGTRPLEVRELREAGYHEVMRHIREVEPPKPSTRVSRLGNRGTDVARHRHTTPERLGKQIRGDLDWIVMKCLEKDRARRYETASGLASDVQRFLSGEPVVAAPPSRLYRFRKFVRRNRAAVTAAVVVAVSLLAGMAGTTYGLLRAEKRQKETQQVSDFQASMLSGIKAEAMGRRIKERFREQVRAALERQYVGEFPDRRKRTPEEIEAELAAFDQRADAAQAVDVARRVMDEFVLARAAAELDKRFTEQPLVRARLHGALGSTYRGLGLYGAAEKHFREALQIWQRELGDDHADTLTSMSRLGHVLFVQHETAKLAEAEEHFRKALEGRRRVLGNLDPATLGSINDMGELLVDRRPDEAERYYWEALEGRRRVLGDKHRDTITSIHNIGYLLRVQGKLEKAEPYFREVLKEDPESLTAMHNMGLLLRAQGRPAEAERCFREVLEKSHPVLGDDHPDLLPTIHALAGTLHAQGRLAKAEPYYSRALEGCRRLLGDDHGLTRNLINDMGVLLVARRKPAEAERYFREALEKSRRLRGDDHEGTLGLIHNLGFALEGQGKMPEAMACYREALVRGRRKLGDGHPDTLNYFNTMGKTLQAKGELDKARSLFEVATRAARSGPGDHPMTAQIEHHYADVLCKLGSIDKALEFAQTAVGRYRAHPEWPPGEAGHGRQVLAEVLRAAGRPAEALAVSWESVQATRQRPGVTQGRLASDLARFASEAIATADRASLEQAEQAARESLEIRRTVLPEDHRLVWLRYDTMSLLGEALVGQAVDASLAVEARLEKFREAEDLLVKSGRWLTRNGGRIPQQYRAERLRQALERVVKLYESWHAAEPDTGKAERAAEWRTKLEKLGRP